MKERTRNVIVGLTTLGGLAGLAYLIWIFGEVPTWVKDDYPVRIHLNDASGLAAGSRVRMHGVDVGYITSVGLMPDPADGVELVARIEQQHEIPANAQVTAAIGLLGGSPGLSITVPPSEPVPPLPKDGSGLLIGTTVSLTSRLESLAGRLEDALPGQLENLNRLTLKIEEFADQYIAVGRQLQQLVEHRPPDQVDRGEATANLSTVLVRADDSVAELQQAIRRVNSMLADDQIARDIRLTAENLRKMSDGGNELIADARQRLDQVTRRFVQVADDLSPSLARLEAMLAEAQEGDGTVGRLIQDPALYNNFQDAAARLSEALTELQLLLQQWRAEGVPFRFF